MQDADAMERSSRRGKAAQQGVRLSTTVLPRPAGSDALQSNLPGDDPTFGAALRNLSGQRRAITPLHARVKDKPGRSAYRTKLKRMSAAILFVLSAVVLASTQTGCLLGRQHPAATQPATAIDPATTRPSYWLDQPAVAHVRSRNFDALWDACREALQSDGFLIDRRDYREGLMTTLPLTSKQAYEFWREDVISPHDLAQSTLSMLRRTVRVAFERLPDGTFEATPKVLVERDSLVERRITSVDQYQTAFAVQAQDVARENQRSGTDIPVEYWYPIARDPALEKQIASSARERLR